MSSERFPPTKPSNLNAEQKKAYEIMSPLAEEFFGDTFTYKNDDGSFIGPFAPLLATPSIFKPYFELIKAVSEIQGLPPTAKETVILATGSHFNGIYETYAHERVGLKTTDLTAEQINQIKVGKEAAGSGCEGECGV